MGIVETEDAAWLAALVHRHEPPPRVCVETGTGTGAFTRLALEAFGEVYTIELSSALVAAHHPDLAAAGALCWHGDSAVMVPRLALALQEPVFWYLDAHWFDGGPDVAEGPLPLAAELAAIADRTYLDVIIIDDVNCFGHGPQPEWDGVSVERIASIFPNAREVVVLGDQLAIYLMSRPRVVYTAGVWDLLHRGHLNLLWASKRCGDILIAGVVSDRGTAAYKGLLPVQPAEVRMRALERLPFLDAVVPQWGTDPSDNLHRFRPDVFTHGDDWSRLKEGHETLAELGVRFVLIPYTEGISSTLLRQARASVHVLETMEVTA